MTLEQRYAASTSPTITHLNTVGTAASSGVDFLDGTPRTKVPAIDAVQTEFTPNEEGSFRYDGKNKKPAATNDKSYPLSRWLAKGRDKGDAYAGDVRFTTLVSGDERNSPNRLIHKYSQLDNKSFFASLPVGSFASARANPKSSGYGPGVTGLRG